jgi:hypothetical protein
MMITDHRCSDAAMQRCSDESPCLDQPLIDPSFIDTLCWP